ncbi:signal peptidase I [Salinispira pacifica]|uniref:signal peptidase I n=1 Tax=Salinispira pacifica TaxID=1307761 RepID=UPI00059C04F6|nr:signal peptidase I [Salinispira pacifica]
MRIVFSFLAILFSMFLFYEVLTSFFLDTAEAASSSMQPGIESGNNLIISKLPYGLMLPFTHVRLPDFDSPERGDIVVLQSPFSKDPYIPVLYDLLDFFHIRRLGIDSPFQHRRPWIIRRVIAVPGDRVYVNGSRAYVQLDGNGDYLEESLVQESTYSLTFPDETFNHPDSLNNYFTNSQSVPDEHVFLLPDNRKTAFGSPSWGPVHISAIRGKVIHLFGRKSAAE